MKTKLKRKCPECRAWREVIVLIIQSLSPGERAQICAKLSRIPKLWKGLSAEDQAQVKLIEAAGD